MLRSLSRKTPPGLSSNSHCNRCEARKCIVYHPRSLAPYRSHSPCKRMWSNHTVWCRVRAFEHRVVRVVNAQQQFAVHHLQFHGVLQTVSGQNGLVSLNRIGGTQALKVMVFMLLLEKEFPSRFSMCCASLIFTATPPSWYPLVNSRGLTGQLGREPEWGC